MIYCVYKTYPDTDRVQCTLHFQNLVFGSGQDMSIRLFIWLSSWHFLLHPYQYSIKYVCLFSQCLFPPIKKELSTIILKNIQKNVLSCTLGVNKRSCMPIHAKCPRAWVNMGVLLVCMLYDLPFIAVILNGCLSIVASSGLDEAAMRKGPSHDHHTAWLWRYMELCWGSWQTCNPTHWDRWWLNPEIGCSLTHQNSDPPCIILKGTVLKVGKGKRVGKWSDLV